MNALAQDNRLLNHYTIQTHPGTLKVHNEKNTIGIATHNEFATFPHHFKESGSMTSSRVRPQYYYKLLLLKFQSSLNDTW